MSSKIDFQILILYRQFNVVISLTKSLAEVGPATRYMLRRNTESMFNIELF